MEAACRVAYEQHAGSWWRKKRWTSSVIDNENIEIVQNYIYFETVISLTCNVSLTLDNLKEKPLYGLFSLSKHKNFSKLAPLLANKILAPIISPVLTYNREVCGGYEESDLKSWDSSQIEKTHPQFCKPNLKVRNKASNVACRPELGRTFFRPRVEFPAQHACKTSAHAQGLYFQIGSCECELLNKNARFWAKIELY